jgi:hypothetical protein
MSQTTTEKATAWAVLRQLIEAKRVQFPHAMELRLDIMPRTIGIDLSVTPDLTAWHCGQCNAIGTGWPPEPIFCETGDCPVKECVSNAR